MTTDLSKIQTSRLKTDEIATEILTNASVVEKFSTKQDKLVSGTNIKTVNNTSLLGSGNIDIQGGADIPSMTLAEYNALETKDPNQYYAITDDNDVSLDILKTIYPVGSLYLTTNTTCPLANLFGTWTLVSQDRVLQGAGSRGAVGTTLQESLPNIKGTFDTGDRRSHIQGTSGALYNNTISSGKWSVVSDDTGNTQGVGFDASRSSSTYQDNAPVQQNAYLINVYRRTA